jgi:hypothetical protein
MSDGLYTNQIDLMLRANPRTKHPYVGTFPSDTLETLQVKKYPSCYIINSDKSGEPGEHWLCVYVDAPQSVIFFDSYALNLSRYKDIHRFVHRLSGDLDSAQRGTIYSLSGAPLQSDTSDVCGHWCIVFADLLSSGLTFEDFLKIFSSKSEQHGTYDNFVKAYVFSEFCKSRNCNVKTLNSIKRHCKSRQQRCVCKHLSSYCK